MLVEKLQKEYKAATQDINPCLLNFIRDYNIWNKIEDCFDQRLLNQARNGKQEYVVRLKPLDQLDSQTDTFLDEYSVCCVDFTIEHRDSNLEKLCKIEMQKLEKSDKDIYACDFDEYYQGIFFRIVQVESDQYDIRIFVSPEVVTDYAKEQGLKVEKTNNMMIFDWGA